MHLALLLLAAQEAHAHPGQAAHRHPTPPQGTWVYYDYVDDSGRLAGGRVELPPALDAAPPSAFAGEGSNVVTLLDNGDPANRLDLVFVGDGYTSSQLGVYANHVNNVWPQVLAEEPLDAYLPYFNIHRVDVVSNQSGVDNDPVLGVQKDTALDMEYWCSGIERLLCVSVPKATAQSNLAPDADQILALANSSTYGGAGYPSNDLATLAGNNGSSIEIALHELGHSLGDLADEYDYGGSTTYTGGEPSQPNASTYTSGTMSSLGEKWHLWLGEPGVGTFEGAVYSKFGVYRPTFNSKMRNLGAPFDEINNEQLVAQIYQVVDPIDDATPEGTYLDDAILFVEPMDPVGHSLDVTWLLDDIAIPGATADTLDVSTLSLAPGLYAVTARVVDNTPYVRDANLRDQYLTEERTWSIAVPTDPQPPLFAAVTGEGYIGLAGPWTLSGAFLDQVTEVRLGGEVTNVVLMDFDTIKVNHPLVPIPPGPADFELDWPGGTLVIDDAVVIGPTLETTTTGIGGTLTASIDLHSDATAIYTLAVSGGALPVPIPIADMAYGLLLDPTAALVAVDSQQFDDAIAVDYPVPNLASLAGSTLYLQAHIFPFTIPLTQSFSTLDSVTF